MNEFYVSYLVGRRNGSQTSATVLNLKAEKITVKLIEDVRKYIAGQALAAESDVIVLSIIKLDPS